MKKRYVVELPAEERAQRETMINRGREIAYRRPHAQALLPVDEGKHGSKHPDKEAAKYTGFSRRTVGQIRECCPTGGLAAALARKPRSDSGAGSLMAKRKHGWWA